MDFGYAQLTFHPPVGRAQSRPSFFNNWSSDRTPICQRAG